MNHISKLAKDSYYKWAEPFPPDTEITMNPEILYGEAFKVGYKNGLKAVLNEIESRKIHMGENPVLVHPEALRALICNMLDPSALANKAKEE